MELFREYIDGTDVAIKLLLEECSEKTDPKVWKPSDICCWLKLRKEELTEKGFRILKNKYKFKLTMGLISES